MLVNEELYDALKEANVSDETARKLARQAVTATTELKEFRRHLIVLHWMVLYVAVAATFLLISFR